MKTRLIAIAVLVVALFVLPAWGAESKFAGQKIDISKMTCKELMSGSDKDRAVGITYFHGFLAGKKNSNIVDVTATSEKTDMVTDYCLSNPSSTVMDAFSKTDK